MQKRKDTCTLIRLRLKKKNYKIARRVVQRLYVINMTKLIKLYLKLHSIFPVIDQSLYTIVCPKERCKHIFFLCSNFETFS